MLKIVSDVVGGDVGATGEVGEAIVEGRPLVGDRGELGGDVGGKEEGDEGGGIELEGGSGVDTGRLEGGSVEDNTTVMDVTVERALGEEVTTRVVVSEGGRVVLVPAEELGTDIADEMS